MAQLEDGERTSDPKRVAEALGNYSQAFARVRTGGEDYLVLGAKENLEVREKLARLKERAQKTLEKAPQKPTPQHQEQKELHHQRNIVDQHRHQSPHL